MTNGQFADILTRRAIQWAADAPASIKRNKHMHNADTNKQIDRDLIEAAVVDYINYVAAHQCGMDLAFYACDLKSKAVDESI